MKMQLLPIVLLPTLAAFTLFSTRIVGSDATQMEQLVDGAGGEFDDGSGSPILLYSRDQRAPMDRSAMVRFEKRAAMDSSIGPASVDRWAWFGKRAPMDRSAMVRFGKRAPMDRAAMVRFGKRAPMDRAAMVRFGRK